MSSIKDSVTVCSDGIVISVVDPKSNQKMMIVLDAAQAHELGIALTEAAWDLSVFENEGDIDFDDDEPTIVFEDKTAS